MWSPMDSVSEPGCKNISQKSATESFKEVTDTKSDQDGKIGEGTVVFPQIIPYSLRTVDSAWRGKFKVI